MTNKYIKNKLIKVRKDININPTEKQKECGNYKKGHISINGFDITIENPKGSYRRGIDSNGKEWKTKMCNDYGYFLNSMGYDGDHVDVFLGNNFESDKIFVVDQKVKGSFDESKVMLGFNSKEEAKKAYLSNYEKDWKGFHKITEVDEETFKKWLYDGKKQRKPFYQYKDIKKVKIMTESILRQIVRESIENYLLNEAYYPNKRKSNNEIGHMDNVFMTPSDDFDNETGKWVNDFVPEKTSYSNMMSWYNDFCSNYIDSYNTEDDHWTFIYQNGEIINQDGDNGKMYVGDNRWDRSIERRNEKKLPKEERFKPIQKRGLIAIIYSNGDGEWFWYKNAFGKELLVDYTGWSFEQFGDDWI